MGGISKIAEPDVLEYEVKWALVSITTNKASGGDEFPAELFQILKDDADKVLCSIYQQIGKLSSGHKIEKGQFSFQMLKKDNTKKCSGYHTIALISQISE